MKSKLFRRLGSLFGLLLLSGALWVLHHELRAYHLHDILLRVRELPTRSLFSGLILTVMSYLIMTGYDTLALRYIRHPLRYGKTALASFIGYAFSNNMGFGMLAGGSVRYRLYSAWGLSTMEITKVIAFCSFTLWIGFLMLAGVVFLLDPLAVPRALHLPFANVHPIGLVFLVLVISYFLLVILRSRPFRALQWEFPLPSVPILLMQMAVAVLDWTLAGGVLYALLPPAEGLSFPGFLGIYLLAQTAGLLSQVPGGLGVFETMVLLLLPSTVSTPQALGALLAYRGIYYIFPLLLAVALLGTQEVIQRRKKFQRLAQIFGRVGSGVVPNVLAFASFVGGAMLLFSGATPAVATRLNWLRNFLPLPLLELSHFLGSLIGTGLLILAWGLQRRLNAAYMLTVTFLGWGILFSLLKGLDYEEAIVLSVIVCTLFPYRKSFYRKSSLFDERFGPGWISAIIIVLLCSVWLGMFSYKHVEYSGELWWRFTFSSNAPRFIRGMVGAIALALFYATVRLLRPSPVRPEVLRNKDLERAACIVQQSRQTYANLALLGDKAFVFSEKKNAFIMYGIEGRSWIAMGDPVGPEDEWPELLWQFFDTCDRYDGWPVFYEVSSKYLPLYLDLGLSFFKLGEEGRVLLDSFSLEGGARKGLRHTKRKLEKEGCLFEVVTAEKVSGLLPELKLVSDAWLAEKNAREKKFSLGFFDVAYLRRFPVAVVRKEGKIIAFANIWQGADREELSLDLMRYLPKEHDGVMDYLFIQFMFWGKQKGYHWFNLGMAPLSGLVNDTRTPIWNRLGAFVFRHAEHFYNFQGLRQYKEKFSPGWEPKYLASPGTLELPRIFSNLASLISGGLKGVITK